METISMDEAKATMRRAWFNGYFTGVIGGMIGTLLGTFLYWSLFH